MTNLSPNARIIAAARSTIGIKEIPGLLHNPEILKMFSTVGHGWVKDDETPWCAAYIGWVLSTIGIKGTGKLNARSYLEWGEVVKIDDALPGDICIKSRGDKNSWTGHVFFVTKVDAKRIYGIGGNQSNAVTEASFLRRDVLGVRRAPGGMKTGPMAPEVLAKMGSRGIHVTGFQRDLEVRGYPVGKRDGIFGNLTRDAVLAFQADMRLPTTGMIDAATANLLGDSTEFTRPLSADRVTLTATELAKRGSDTIREARGGERTSILTGAGGLFTYLLTVKDDIAAVVSTVEGAGAQAGALAPYAIPVFLGAVAIVLLVRHFHRIKEARVADARDGLNLGR